jgi:hypothetical protein
MYRNALTIPPPGRCYCCGRTDGNWIDDEQNLCGDCVCTHILCDSCGTPVGKLEDWCRELPPGFTVDTPVICGRCLTQRLDLKP